MMNLVEIIAFSDHKFSFMKKMADFVSTTKGQDVTFRMIQYLANSCLEMDFYVAPKMKQIETTMRNARKG